MKTVKKNEKQPKYKNITEKKELKVVAELDQSQIPALGSGLDLLLKVCAGPESILGPVS